MKRTRVMAWAAGALLIGSALEPAMAVTNLIANGGFELGPINPNGHAITANQPFANLLTLTPGDSTSITGWTTIGPGSIDLIGSNYWQPSEGSRSLDLDGTRLDGASPPVIGGPGGVQQLVTGLISGELYKLSFDLAGNPDRVNNPPFPIEKKLGVNVNINGSDVPLDPLPPYVFNPQSVGSSREDMKWTTISVEFTATGTSALIKFLSLDVNPPLGGNWGPALDNVILEQVDDSTGVGDPDAVPEPLTAGTSLLALLAVAGATTRRR